MWGNQAAHASVAGVLPGPRFWGDLTLANCLSTTVSITLSTIPVEAPDCHSGVGWPSVGQVAIYPHESGTAPHFLALPYKALAFTLAGLTPAERVRLRWTHNRTGGFTASGSPVGSCVSHTEHPGNRGQQVIGLAGAAQLPPCGARCVQWVVEPVDASTTPRLKARFLHLGM